MDQQSIASADHPTVMRVLASNEFLAARSYLFADHARIVAENIALQQIPAPYREEARKAAAFAAMLREASLEEVAIDAEGNALGLRRGSSAGGAVAFISHLDTVFPLDTELSVRTEGSLLFGPGIADNTRGLAAMLGIARAMAAAEIGHRRDILFVGSVGEEGLGDLRGVRYLFERGPWRDRIAAALVHDGCIPQRLTISAVGSKRYRIEFAGPGGHSFNDFGLVNPVYAMSRVAIDLSALPVPENTSFNVGRLEGGSSVNAIPGSAHMLVDLRSTDPAALRRLDQRLRDIVADAVAAENATRSVERGAVVAEMRLLGERPSGTTDAGEEIVRIAATSLRALGWEPRFIPASTDANLPIGLGIPTVTMSSGIGGNLHSANEYLNVETEPSVRQMSAVLACLVALAEFE